MRRAIKSALMKKRFNAAWGALPVDVQGILKPFIRQVREVKSIKNTRINCPNGTQHGPLLFGTGYAFFYKDESIAFSDVILPAVLNDFTEGETLGVIMHELAHAYEYATKHEEAIDNANSEIDAWDQAISWAKSSKLAVEIVSEIEECALKAKLQETFEQIVNKAISWQVEVSGNPKS